MPDFYHIIASQHPWNHGLPERLALKTNQKFILVQNKEMLLEELASEVSIGRIFFTHWSDRIPQNIWEAYESIIFHMTDVPYGRGGSPLQNLIIRGHQETVVSALRCVEALDAGPVYLKAPLALVGTAQEIYQRADKVIEKMIVEILEEDPVPKVQEGEPVFFKRRKPEDGQLTSAENTSKAFDMIRMLDAEGYPSAFLETDKLKFEFKQAQQKNNKVEAVVIISER